MVRPPLGPLVILLLAIAGQAVAAAGEPARHSADGGGCTPAQDAAEADAPQATAGPAGADANAATERPGARSVSAGERTRVRLRWHAFVPGMFK